jgi:hypothetical protein
VDLPLSYHIPCNLVWYGPRSIAFYLATANHEKDKAGDTGKHMICPDPVLSLVEPHEEVLPEILKILRVFDDLLAKVSRQAATVVHESGTVDKVRIMELTSMITATGFDGANELLRDIQRLVLHVLVAVNDSENIRLAVEMLIQVFRGDDGTNPLFVHRTTAEHAEPKLTRKQIDEVLGDDYKECMSSASELGAQSGKVMLAIDFTEEQCRTKFKNGLHSAVRAKRGPAWELGYKYAVVTDVSHEFFAGCIHRGSWINDNDPASYAPWIHDIQSCIKRVRETGSDVVGVEADREYFAAECFALATAGKLAEPDARFSVPRMITPRKFGPDKTAFTWAFLLETKRGQVFVDYMTLDVSKSPALKELAEDLFENISKNLYRVPYTCVALIDEYRSEKERSLEKIRAEARAVNEGMSATTKELQKVEKQYLANHAKESKKGKKPVAVPSLGRGLKRRRFNGALDRRLYFRCLELQRKKKQLEKQKAALISSIVFFAISMWPGEDPTKEPETFIAIAKDYHSRWCLENGLKMVKHAFHRHVHGRKPTKRQLAMVQGMIVQNHWQVERKAEIRRELEAMQQPILFWDVQRWWIRRKFEQEMHGLLPAVRFLVDCWLHAITSTIDKKLMEVI